MAARNFDVIVFGATGYVGRILCQRLQGLSHPVRWAAAGRSHSRIEETLAGVGVTGSTIIEADCHDLESMRALAAQGKVVINATGPAVTMGENVVRACIDSKTDYADITGEVDWVDGMRRRFHRDAEAAGVHVVSCTGFDSVPADLLTFIGNKTLEDKGFGKIGKAEIIFKIKDVGVPHGTIETVITSRERQAAGKSRYIPAAGQGSDDTGIPLIPKESMGYLKKSMQAMGPVTWVDAAQQYGFMHVMKSIDERIVFASAHELGYAKDLILKEVSLPPKKFNYLKGSLFSTAVVSAMGASFLLAKYDWFKGNLRGLVKGSSEEGFVHAKLVATNAAGDAKVKAFMNTPKLGAGMGLTSVACLESALALAEKDKVPLPGRPGFRTPAVAFGTLLWDRLVRNPEFEVGVECVPVGDD